CDKAGLITPNKTLTKNGVIDIKGIDKTKYLYLWYKVQISGSNTPFSVSSITTQWIPDSLLNLKANLIKSESWSGENFSINLTYSAARIDAKQTKIYLLSPVPNSATTIAPSLISPSTNFATSKEIYLGSGSKKTRIPAGTPYISVSNIKSAEMKQMTLTYQSDVNTPSGEKISFKFAIGSDNSLVGDVSNKVVELVNSDPDPKQTLRVTSGAYKIDGENIVSQLGDGKVTYEEVFQNQNSRTLGITPIINPKITINITEIANYFIEYCHLGTGDIAGRFSGSGYTYSENNGVYSLVYSGNSVNGNAHATNIFSFQVDLKSNCQDFMNAAGKSLRVTATASGDNVSNLVNSVNIKLFCAPTSKGEYALGESLDGGMSITGGSDDRAGSSVTWGQTTVYVPQYVNKGLNYMINPYIVIPIDPNKYEFQRADTSTGTIYYSTADFVNGSDGDYPSFDTKTPPGNGWSASLPANLSDIRWVIFSTPCLASSIDKNTEVEKNVTACKNAPSKIQATVKVALKDDGHSQSCQTDTINIVTFAHTDRDISLENNPAFTSEVVSLQYSDFENTIGKPPLPEVTSSLGSSQAVDVGQTVDWTYTIRSTGDVTLGRVKAQLEIHSILVGDQWFDPQILMSPGSANPKNGEIVNDTNSQDRRRVFKFDLGDMSVSTSKDLKFSIRIPEGVLSASQIRVTSNVYGYGPTVGFCGGQEYKSSASANYTVNPLDEWNIPTHLTRNQGYIMPRNDMTNPYDKIDYMLDSTNISGLSIANPILISAVPENVELLGLSSSGEDKFAGNYECPGCKFYFASKDMVKTGKLDGDFDSTYNWTNSKIMNNFVLGQDLGNGKWDIPAAWLSSDSLSSDSGRNNIAYIAVIKDYFYYGETIKIGYNTRDYFAADKIGHKTPQGSVHTADSGIIYNNQFLPQNKVTTLVLANIQINIQKSGSPTVNSVDGETQWDINFDSAGDVKHTFKLTDNLPKYVKPTAMWVDWNKIAQDSPMNLPKKSDLSEFIDKSYDSKTQKLTLNFADGKTNSDSILAKLASGSKDAVMPGVGGTLHIKTKIDESAYSLFKVGSTLSNYAQGCAANVLETGISNEECVNSNAAIVTIINPSMKVIKTTDADNPVTGDVVYFYVNVVNSAAVEANKTIIQDILPAGLCFNNDLTANDGWQISGVTQDPLSNNDCGKTPTKITIGNIKYDKLDTGVFPAEGQLRLVYSATVSGDLQSGKIATNTAASYIRNAEEESDSSRERLNNCPVNVNDWYSVEKECSKDSSSADVVKAITDVYSKVSVESNSVMEKQTYTYYLKYGNQGKEVASDAAVLVKLPKYSSVYSVIKGNKGDKIYYYKGTESDWDKYSDPKNSDYKFKPGYNYVKDSDWTDNPLDGGISGGQGHPVGAVVIPESTILKYGEEHSVDFSYTAPTSDIVSPGTPFTLASNTITSTSQQIEINYQDWDKVKIEKTEKDNKAALINDSSSNWVTIPRGDLAIAAKPSVLQTRPNEDISWTINIQNSGLTKICAVNFDMIVPHDSAYITDTNPEGLKVQDLRTSLTEGSTFAPIDNLGNPTDISNTVHFRDNSDHFDNFGEPMLNWVIGDVNNPQQGYNSDHNTNACISAGGSVSFTVSGKVVSTLPQGENIQPIFRVDNDWVDEYGFVPGSPEDPRHQLKTDLVDSNNQAITNTLVYRPDVMLVINGQADNSGSADSLEANEGVTYTVQYNNIGKATADDVIFHHSIPVGTCFKIGSIVNIPEGGQVSYSNNNGESYDYQPSTSNSDSMGVHKLDADCNVTDFRIYLTKLVSPANSKNVDLKLQPPAEYIQTVSGQNHTCGLTVVGNVFCWGDNTY
ncbi:MAG: DUF11 domain-containing protein, partial [Candidatus Ancillula sp.]|nr:DUF11 domain-containing protein [Candidatus Ancillula sp.]